MKQANPAPNRVRKQFSSGAQHALKRAAFHTSRTYYFMVALFVFAILTGIALRQGPRPDPFQPVQTLSWDWWQYPLERNAFKRLPVITSNLKKPLRHTPSARGACFGVTSDVYCKQVDQYFTSIKV